MKIGKKGIGLLSALVISSVIIGTLTYTIINVLPSLRMKQQEVRSGIQYRLFITSMSNYFLYAIKNRILFKLIGSPTTCSNIKTTKDDDFSDSCRTIFEPDAEIDPVTNQPIGRSLEYVMKHPLNFERMLLLNDAFESICNTTPQPNLLPCQQPDRDPIRLAINKLQVVMTQDELKDINIAHPLYTSLDPVRGCIEAVLFTAEKPYKTGMTTQNEEVKLLITVEAKIRDNCPSIQKVVSESLNLFVGRQLHTMSLYMAGDLKTNDLKGVNFHGPVYVDGNIILPPTTNNNDLNTPKFSNKVYLGPTGNIMQSDGTTPFLISSGSSITNNGGNFINKNGNSYFRGFWQGITLESERDEGLCYLFNTTAACQNETLSTNVGMCTAAQQLIVESSHTSNTRLVASQFKDDNYNETSIKIGITNPNFFRDRNTSISKMDENFENRTYGHIYRNPGTGPKARVQIDLSSKYYNGYNNNNYDDPSSSKNGDLSDNTSFTISYNTDFWNKRKDVLSKRINYLNTFHRPDLNRSDRKPDKDGREVDKESYFSKELMKEIDNLYYKWIDNRCHEYFDAEEVCEEKDECAEPLEEVENCTDPQITVPDNSCTPEVDDGDEKVRTCGQYECRRPKDDETDWTCNCTERECKKAEECKYVSKTKEDIIYQPFTAQQIENCGIHEITRGNLINKLTNIKSKATTSPSITVSLNNEAINQVRLVIDRSKFKFGDQDTDNYFALFEKIKVSITKVYDFGNTDELGNDNHSSGGPNRKDGHNPFSITISNPYDDNTNNISLSNTRLKSNRSTWLRAKETNSNSYDTDMDDPKLGIPSICTSANNINSIASSTAPAGWDASFVTRTRHSWILGNLATEIIPLAPTAPDVPIDTIYFNNQEFTTSGTTFENSTQPLARTCLIEANRRDPIYGVYSCEHLIIQNRSEPLHIIGSFIVNKITIGTHRGIDFYSLWDPEKRPNIVEDIIAPNSTCQNFFESRPLSAVMNNSDTEEQLEYCSPRSLASNLQNFTWWTVDPELGYPDSTTHFPARKIKHRPKRYTAVQLSRKDTVRVLVGAR